MATPRRPLSKKTRFDVFKRDDFRCVYCGSSPPDVKLHADHVLPIIEGGSDDPSNLVTACDSCNLGKGARMLDAHAEPGATPEKTEDLRERRDQIAAYRRSMRAWVKAKREAEEEQVQIVAEAISGKPNMTWDGESNPKARASVLGFIRTLGVKRTVDAAEVAYRRNARDPFAYFCSVCHAYIREEREDAE